LFLEIKEKSRCQKNKGVRKTISKKSIRTFGCQMNDADSEVMDRLLEREGYRKIDSPEGADVIIPSSAKKLGLSEYRIRELIREKRIRAMKIGQWGIRPEDLKSFIKSRSNME